MTQNLFICRFTIIYIYYFITHKFSDNYLEDVPSSPSILIKLCSFVAFLHERKNLAPVNENGLK